MDIKILVLEKSPIDYDNHKCYKNKQKTINKKNQPSVELIFFIMIF